MSQKKNQVAEQVAEQATEQVAEQTTEQATEQVAEQATEQVARPNVDGLYVVRIGFIDKNTKKDYSPGDIIEAMPDARVEEINAKIPGALEPAAIINAGE